MELQAMAALAAKYVNTTNRHIFLTGKAGTGKTTFLRYIVENTYKNTVIAAPTGIAAINAGGVTLHSLLQLPFGTFIPDDIPLSSSENPITTPRTLFKNSKFNATKRKLIQELELLIIDEVSMLRADLLDCIDLTMRYLRKNRKRPFGGVQLLLIGDLMQLPPVVKDDEKNLLSAFYPSMYFFEARALEENPPIRVELQKIFRQQDQDFIDLLNRLRHNEQTNDDVLFLNRFYNPDFDQTEETGYIHLTTHNYRADKLNQHRLNSLDSEMLTYKATIEGTFPESMYPTATELYLKEGAQVMFIKNDPSGEGQFFNGKIGMVSSLLEDEIWVRFENGNEVKVDLYRWENKRYVLDQITEEIEESLMGSFDQFPLKLAWAVTIHKSQGLTFEKAVLDLSGTFAPGQLYVALSRLTSLKGLVFSSPLPEEPPDIDENLASFNNSFEEEEDLQQNLSLEQKQFIFDFTKSAFDFSLLIARLKEHESSFNKEENRSIKQSYLGWTRELVDETIPLQKVGETFVREVSRIMGQAQYLDGLAERTTKAQAYFFEVFSNLHKQVVTQRSGLKKEKNVKHYVKELQEFEELYLKCIRRIEKLALLVEASSQQRMLTKDDINQLAVNQLALQTTTTRKSEKVPTAAISYQLYQEGKSIEEIAEARGLVPGTIEGHLSKYVAEGLIEVSELLPKEKLSNILKAAEQPYENTADIKAILPADYSYGEIKLVLASLGNTA